MKINLLVLSKAIGMICRKYMNGENQSIETDVDWFWSVDMKEAVDLSMAPTKICVESMEDDYKSLIELADGKREANIVDLDHAADLLRLLSYEIEKQR